MATASSPRPRLDWLVGRHVAGAFLVLVGFYALMALNAGPLVVPGYLVVLGSDAIQNPLLPDLRYSAYTAYFILYLYGLAMLLGGATRTLRQRLDCASA